MNPVLHVEAKNRISNNKSRHPSVSMVEIQGVAAQQCTKSRACAVRTNCCSRENYCGPSAEHCGAGCKNGPCTGGDGKGSGAPWSTFLTKAVFERFFPSPPRGAFYSYEAFVTAGKEFPAFGRRGIKLETTKRELAAFLAHVKHETRGLTFFNEQNIPRGELYCMSNAWYPCAPGKSYHGRGPLQLSYNYNYGAFGDDLSPVRRDLLKNPDLLARDAVLAFKAALWFWMRGCHDAITAYPPSFGKTIRAINGGVECDGKAPSKVASRVANYKDFCNKLGIPYGPNLGC